MINDVDIKPGLCSDHSMIRLNIELSYTNRRGRGFWKFNNDLLTEQTYIELIKKTINNIKCNVNMTDKNQYWEFVKCQIRTKTIDYSIQRSKTLKKDEENLILKTSST